MRIPSQPDTQRSSHGNSNKVSDPDSTHEVRRWILGNELAKIEQRDGPGEFGAGEVQIFA